MPNVQSIPDFADAIATKSRVTALVCTAMLAGTAHLAQAQSCSAQSADLVNPVIELYTSEGCSSCPPADRWLSKLKGQPSSAVIQAFHVGYWDYIGWVDRFASPSHTQRQREIARANNLGSIYTPQMVKDGRDWRGWFSSGQSAATQASGRAKLSIALTKNAKGEVTASIAPTSPEHASTPWAAYWSTTEHSHASRVSAGENKGEHLLHDYVVRQYTPVGRYSGPQTLRFVPLAAEAAHPQRVNLVLHDPKTGATIQALSLACG
jgi:hypothetical protein